MSHVSRRSSRSTCVGGCLLTFPPSDLFTCHRRTSIWHVAGGFATTTTQFLQTFLSLLKFQAVMNKKRTMDNQAHSSLLSACIISTWNAQRVFPSWVFSIEIVNREGPFFLRRGVCYECSLSWVSWAVNQGPLLVFSLSNAYLLRACMLQ